MYIIYIICIYIYIYNFASGVTCLYSTLKYKALNKSIFI